YLIKLIPPDKMQMIDLEGKLQLEYYKLQKTFEGAITLKEESGSYTPATAKSSAKSEEKQPLDEVIKKINEQYKGKFTNADRVLVGTLMTTLMNDTKLQNMAKTSDPLIFKESIFPKIFHTTAQNSYMESQSSYANLFEDQAKYNAIMCALSDIIYREMRVNSTCTKIFPSATF
ncbi:MAG: type I restriction endonuclease subunit R, partial [Selenomonadaceae bacterium]|nr:type I restriction endonuclease subunit R [Selenomonadaceae bacterium]